MDTSAQRPRDRTASRRRGPDDWIAAASEALAAGGVEAVRVEKLAKALNVTKGSFYWHFKDRDALLDALLEQWRERNSAEIRQFVALDHDPHAMLRQLTRVPFALDLAQLSPRMSLSLRLWARHDPRVRRVLDEVDALRTDAWADLFERAGFEAVEARARAVLLYSYMRVALELVKPGDDELQQSCQALLIP